MNPIKHSDIVQPGNPFEQAIQGAQFMEKELLRIIGNIKSQMSSMGGSLSGAQANTPGGQNNIKGQSADIQRMAAQVKTLEKQLSSVTTELNKMRKAYEELSKVQSKTTPRATTQTTEEYKKQITYTRLLAKEQQALEGSYAKLSATLSRMKFEQKNFFTTGSAGYKKLGDDIALTTEKLKKLDAANGVFGRSVGNYAIAARQAWLQFSVAIAGTVYTVRRWMQINAELSDAMAAVRRTTGMTQAEVYKLNQTLKGFDTRTAQTSLLDLAHVAGKLGIAKEEIAGFVKGADMIGVALGKDIGNNEEAINQLGRIVQIFKLSGEFGMEKALLKVGSALKDLGNASVAEEQNIIDFTKRMGGLSSIVRMPVDKIMALAATMDMLGQTMEVSSTAINQMWIAMGKNVEETAKIAGMSAKEFSKLMKTDFNEAFIALAKGFAADQGGLMETANKFGGLAIDGRRLIGVMTALANNTQVYREQMDIAKKSLDAGTTAAQQFAIQNETLAAQLDKVEKAFKNTFANENNMRIWIGLIRGLTNAYEGLQKGMGFIGEWVSNGMQMYPDLPSEGEVMANLQKIKDAERVRQEEITIKAFQMLEEDHKQSMIKKYEDIANSYLAMWKKTEGKTKQHYATQYSYAKDFADRLKALNAKKEPGKPGADSDIPVPSDDAYKKAKQEAEAYYQFQLRIGTATWDDILKYEKQKLIDQGIWRRATEKEQQEALKEIRQKYVDEQDQNFKKSIATYIATLSALRGSVGTAGFKNGKYQINSQNPGHEGMLEYGTIRKGWDDQLRPDGGDVTANLAAGLNDWYDYFAKLQEGAVNPFNTWPDETQRIFDEIAQTVQSFASSVSAVLGSLSNYYQVQMDNEMNAADERYNAEYEAIDRMLANKEISERRAAQKKTILEKQQRAEQLKIEKDYRKKQQDLAYIQAVINIAVGVTQALAESGPLGILTGLIVAAAGAIELETISSQKFAKGGSGEFNTKGTVLRGKRHDQGGINLPGIGEAEDGEYFAIINRNATQKYRNELPELFEAINQGRMNQLFDNRGVSGVTVNVNDKYGKEMLNEMRKPKSETRVFDMGNKVVYETGNYRLITNKQ